MNTRFSDWGIIDYMEAWCRQESIFKSLVEAKQGKKDTSIWEQFVFCEHPHVFTLGKNGNTNNMLVNKDMLASLGASFYKVNRGGDITYHGPGQIVGYPLLDLENYHLSLKQYLYCLEETIIRVLAHYGIAGERLPGATGVWLDAHSSKPRKICAMGVRASHFVTMHGFALNVCTDLKYFKLINPCGFKDKDVTSIFLEINTVPEMEDIKNTIQQEWTRMMETKNLFL
ncbi:MAG: lipoyl(octanoyl) transferase LipB [Bacteroidales bacterium]|jgi:lipoyl(octanoyl) transferase|nr:lipoyl(octanoyl) transferase LipB [Bacteroidales bacterium]